MRRMNCLLFAGLLATAASCAAVDTSLISLVMPDAKVVSGIHVEHTKSTPFGRYVLAQMQSDDQGFQKFVDETGFDPRRDLNEILVASTGNQGSSPHTLVLGRGVFDASRVRAAAKQAGVTTIRYHGIDILQHKEDKDDNGVALLNGSTAVFGDLASVEAAIDRQQSGEAPAAALVDKVRRVSMDNDVWFVTVGTPAELFNGKLRDPNLNGAMKGDVLQSVQEASGGLRFGASDVSLNAQFVARTEKDANALADVVRFFAGMVQLNRPAGSDNGKASSLLDSLQLSAEANVMKLSLAMPEAQLEKLLAQSHHPRGTVSRRH